MSAWEERLVCIVLVSQVSDEISGRLLAYKLSIALVATNGAMPQFACARCWR